MSVASGVVRPALRRSVPSRYSTVPVIATGSPAASGIDATRYAVVVLPFVPGDADQIQFARRMMMNFGSSQGHRAANVRNPDPSAV